MTRNQPFCCDERLRKSSDKRFANKIGLKMAIVENIGLIALVTVQVRLASYIYCSAYRVRIKFSPVLIDRSPARRRD